MGRGQILVNDKRLNSGVFCCFFVLSVVSSVCWLVFEVFYQNALLDIYFQLPINLDIIPRKRRIPCF